jgi:autotransporter-associated beta strand protein
MTGYNQILDPNNADIITAAGGSRLRAEGTNSLFNVVLNPGPPVFFEIPPASALNVTSLAGDGLGFVDGGGTLRLTGPSPFHGQIVVGQGRLIVNGPAPMTGQVFVSNPQGLLGGTGLLGGVQVASGTVSPGESSGILTVASLIYNAGGASSLQIELAGLVPGVGYDQLNATGSVTIGPTTSLVASRSFLPGIGSAFTIVSAPGGVTGQFVGLPDLAQFQINGQTYQIDYTPASVVLTAMDTMPVTLQKLTVE